MATYIQGEQGLIPSLQPFNPNLNLISGALQQKQSKFDTNYKQLNKIYNQYVFGDLSREENIQRRDNTVKQIDLDLKRIATLDLSLEKNVNQAVKVFAPLYEDPYLMVDMAKTKNYKSRRGEAAALQTSLNKDQRSLYWREGVEYMDYMMEDFKAMSQEETLSSPDITYTPYVNVSEKLQKIAKDANLSVDVTTQSKDGMYFVRDKNGSLLVDPLTRLFSQSLADDPAAQDAYRVKAYVARKRDIYANKERLGSAEVAERDYLMRKYNELQSFSAEWNKKNNQALKAKNNTINEISRDKNEGKYNERTDAALQEQEESKQRLQGDAALSGNLQGELSDGESSSVSLRKEADDITQDINRLRAVVDYGQSVLFMQDDIFGSAEALAMTDVKHDISVNPVGLEGLRHSHRIGEIDRRASHNEKAIRLKAGLDANKEVLKNNLKTGVWVSDTEGNVLVNPEIDKRLEKTDETGGASTPGLKATKVNKQYESDLANEQAAPAMKLMLDYLKGEVANDNLTQKEAGAFFSTHGKTLDEVEKLYNKNPGNFFIGQGYEASLTKNRFETYLKTAKKGTDAADKILNSNELATFNQYVDFTAAAKQTRRKNVEVAQKLVSDGVYEAGLANENSFFSRDINVNLTAKERKILDEKLPQYFMQNTTGPVSFEVFAKQAYADKELNAVLRKIKFGRESQKVMEANVAPLNPLPFIGKFIGDVRSDATFLEKVYDTYNANWDTKKNSTKFKSYYVGNYVPGSGGSEYALDASTGHGITVFPTAYGTPNRNIWTETMSDINDMSKSFTDPSIAKISFNGIGKESSTDDTDVGLAVIRALNSKMSGKAAEKINKFEIYSYQIANEDPRKGAMLIMPNAEDLKSLVGTKNEPGIIDAETRNKILKNGISVIAPKEQFNNFLMKEGGITPAEAMINANGSYEYKNPGGAGSFKITKSGGGYNVTGIVRQMDENTGEVTYGEINRPANFGRYGNSIDAYIQNMQNQLITIGKQYDNTYRKFNPVKK